MAEQISIAAAILAGGKAERLGGLIKGNIEIAPELSIIHNILIELDQVGITEIVILANEPEPYLQYQKRIIPDACPRIGPLGGITSALDHFYKDFDATLILPCDLPYIGYREIFKLLEAYKKETPNIMFAKTRTGKDHPLCAVIKNSILPEINFEIVRGERRVLQAWQKLDGKTITFKNERAFFNLNTPEDLEILKNGY